MFNLGMGEITVILLLALIFLGPKKLPELASGLGKLIREIRKTTADVKNEIQLDDAIRKPFEELRDAVTLHPEELKRRDRIRRDLEAAQRAMDEAAKKIEEASSENADVTQADLAAPAPLGTEATMPVTAGASANAAENGAQTPPPFPTAAPIGTIARDSSGPSARLSAMTPIPPPTVAKAQSAEQSDLGKTLLRMSESRRETARGMAAVGTPPTLANSAADRGNATQALSEADLAAMVASSSSVPPPPPLMGRTGRTVPPPLPGLPGTRPTPAPAPAATDEKKPEPTT